MLAYNKGKLVKWHDDRGYGFIEPENNAKQVFVHISVFKRRAARRPQEGDVIWYQLDMDNQERIQASNVYIEGISYGSTKNRTVSDVRKEQSRSTTQQQKSSMPSKHNESRFRKQAQPSAMDRFQKHQEQQKRWQYIIIFIVVIVGVLIVKGIISTTQTAAQKETSPNQTYSYSTSTSFSSEPSQSFQCAGKTRCSEMSSCEEAFFYQNNCSGAQMDGDGDGKPCEDRCGH